MAEQQRVLIVESNPKSANVLGEALRSGGFQTSWVGDGVHALNMARRTTPDAMLLSAALAGGGGLAVLRRIRSNVHTTTIPVIMLGAEAVRREALEAGAQACVPPGADAGSLCKAIRENMLQSLDFTEAPASVIASPQRLEALEKTRMLDSAPEPSYEKLTRMVASLLGAPTALLTLVGKDRQFFKSQVGLAQPWAAQRQTRLSHSFCQWVVSGREELVVDDAREHPTLRSNLAIRDLGVVAYAGVPLNKGNEVLGSFCAIDSRPRAWSEEDLATLRDLAQLAEAFIVLDAGDKAESGHDSYARLQASGNAAGAIGRILHRCGARLAKEERSELLAQAERFGQQYQSLLSTVGK